LSTGLVIKWSLVQVSPAALLSTDLGKPVTHIFLCHQTLYLVPAKWWLCSAFGLKTLRMGQKHPLRAVLTVVKVQLDAGQRRAATYRKWPKAFLHVIFSVEAGKWYGERYEDGMWADCIYSCNPS